MRTAWVYGIVADRNVVYVGITTKSPTERLDEHLAGRGVVSRVLRARHPARASAIVLDCVEVEDRPHGLHPTEAAWILYVRNLGHPIGNKIGTCRKRGVPHRGASHGASWRRAQQREARRERYEAVRIEPGYWSGEMLPL